MNSFVNTLTVFLMSVFTIRHNVDYHFRTMSPANSQNVFIHSQSQRVNKFTEVVLRDIKTLSELLTFCT